VKEAVKVQLELDLSGNIAMDTPELSFDELTSLAKDRETWCKSMLRHDTDTSELMEAPKSPYNHSTPQTAAEREAVQAVWNTIFRLS